MADKTRDEMVAISNAAADAAGAPRLLVLACAIAEGNLNPNARRPTNPADDERYWPDVSGSTYQQAVRWDPDYHGGDGYPGADEVERVLTLQRDPVRSARIAAENLAGKFHDGTETLDDENLARDLYQYNWPGGHERPYSAATAENYARGLREARAILGATPVTTPTPTPTYNPDTPPQRQRQDWTCSIRSTAWVLAALGLPFDIGDLQDEMSPKYVTPALGLLDKRGYGVAATIKAHLPADWQDRVHVFEHITWDELKSLAGSGPIALGLEGAYHWIAVAKVRDDGDLDAANPAPGYPLASPIGDVLSRAEFDKYGPAAAVWVQADVAAPDAGTGGNPDAAPSPADDPAAWIKAVADLADRIAAIEDRDQRLAEAQRVRLQFVGPRPSQAA